MEKEVWRTIKGYEFYQVSSHGRVRSVERMVQGPHGGMVRRSGVLLNMYPDRRGEYHFVMLYKDVKPRRRAVHILVANAFIGPCPPGKQVCHKDGNDTHNYYKNLRYGTPKSNSADKQVHGTQLRGVQVGISKLDENKVRRIRKLHAKGKTQTELAVMFNVSQPNIGQIVRRKTWAHII